MRGASSFPTLEVTALRMPGPTEVCCGAHGPGFGSLYRPAGHGLWSLYLSESVSVLPCETVKLSQEMCLF